MAYPKGILYATGQIYARRFAKRVNHAKNIFECILTILVLCEFPLSFYKSGMWIFFFLFYRKNLKHPSWTQFSFCNSTCREKIMRDKRDKPYFNKVNILRLYIVIFSRDIVNSFVNIQINICIKWFIVLSSGKIYVCLYFMIPKEICSISTE